MGWSKGIEDGTGIEGGIPPPDLGEIEGGNPPSLPSLPGKFKLFNSHCDIFKNVAYRVIGPLLTNIITPQALPENFLDPRKSVN